MTATAAMVGSVGPVRRAWWLVVWAVAVVASHIFWILNDVANELPEDLQRWHEHGIVVLHELRRRRVKR